MNEFIFYSALMLLAALYLILDENYLKKLLGWAMAWGTLCVVGGVMFLQKTGLL